MSILLPLSVFGLILIGALIYNVKDVNKLWKITIGTILSEIAVIATIFTNKNNLFDKIESFELFGSEIGFKLNNLGLLYCIVACILWFVSAIASKEYFGDHSKNMSRYYSSLLITLGGCLGVFLANDLFTLFVFFELMSFASYVWVAQNQEEKSTKASKSYLSFATVGGLVMLFGIFILMSEGKSLEIANLSTVFEHPTALTYVASAMLLFGYGAKAGLFMLHDWLALAHTAAPAPASGLLSGLLTKTGVYGIIIVTLKILPHSDTWAVVVLCFAICNMLFGAIFAFMSNDLKRTLAFSSVSQIGFILWGVSFSSLLHDHNTYAAYGTVFHMINHSLIKIVLFSLAGIIYQNTHSLNLNVLQGFGRDKPWLKIMFAIGSLSIMGIPLFSGYVSKTLLHESVVEYMHLYEVSALYNIAEILFLIAGGFTFAYMLKLFICIFVEKPKKNHENEHYTTQKTKMAISFVCVMLLALGITPNISFGAIGEFVSKFMETHALDHSVHYFSFINLKGSVISIAIGLFLYYFVAKRFVMNKKQGYIELVDPKYTVENCIYKPTIKFLAFVGALVARILDVIFDAIIFVINRLGYKSVRIPKEFFIGKEETDAENTKISISQSLAYSLLLFGIGFIATVLYLLLTEIR